MATSYAEKFKKDGAVFKVEIRYNSTVAPPYILLRNNTLKEDGEQLLIGLTLDLSHMLLSKFLQGKNQIYLDGDSNTSGQCQCHNCTLNDRIYSAMNELYGVVTVPYLTDDGVSPKALARVRMLSSVVAGYAMADGWYATNKKTLNAFGFATSGELTGFVVHEAINKVNSANDSLRIIAKRLGLTGASNSGNVSSDSTWKPPKQVSFAEAAKDPNFKGLLTPLVEQVVEADTPLDLIKACINNLEHFKAAGEAPTVVRHWTQDELLDRFNKHTSESERVRLGNTVLSGFNGIADYKKSKITQGSSSMFLDIVAKINVTCSKVLVDSTYRTTFDSDVQADNEYQQGLKKQPGSKYDIDKVGADKMDNHDGWYSVFIDQVLFGGLGMIYNAQTGRPTICAPAFYEKLKKATKGGQLYLPRGLMFNVKGETRLATPDEIAELNKYTCKNYNNGWMNAMTWTSDPCHDEDPALAEHSAKVLEIVRNECRLAMDVEIVGVSPRRLRYFSDGNTSTQHPGLFGMRLAPNGHNGGHMPMLYDGPAFVLSVRLDGRPLPGRVYVTPDGRFICSDWCQREIGKGGGGIDLVTGKVLKHTILTWLIGPGYQHVGGSGFSRSKFTPVRPVGKSSSNQNLRTKLQKQELPLEAVAFFETIMQEWRDAKTWLYTNSDAGQGNILKKNKDKKNDPRLAVGVEVFPRAGYVNLSLFKWGDWDDIKDAYFGVQSFLVYATTPLHRIAASKSGSIAYNSPMRLFANVSPTVLNLGLSLWDMLSNKVSSTADAQIAVKPSMHDPAGVLSTFGVYTRFDPWMIMNALSGEYDEALGKPDATIHKWLDGYQKMYDKWAKTNMYKPNIEVMNEAKKYRELSLVEQLSTVKAPEPVALAALKLGLDPDYMDDEEEDAYAEDEDNDDEYNPEEEEANPVYWKDN